MLCLLHSTQQMANEENAPRGESGSETDSTEGPDPALRTKSEPQRDDYALGGERERGKLAAANRRKRIEPRGERLIRGNQPADFDELSRVVSEVEQEPVASLRTSTSSLRV
jgi:hypothetical protein